MPSLSRSRPLVYLTRVVRDFILFYRLGRNRGWSRPVAVAVALVDAPQVPH